MAASAQLVFFCGLGRVPSFLGKLADLTVWYLHARGSCPSMGRVGSNRVRICGCRENNKTAATAIIIHERQHFIYLLCPRP